MERKPISLLKNNIVTLEKSFNKVYLSLSNTKSISILVNQEISADLLLLDLKEESEVNIEVSEGASLHLSLLAENVLNNAKITANIGQNAKIDVYFADFIKSDCLTNITINLNGENATCDWHLASLADGTQKKEFDVSAFHNTAFTFAKLDNYGVVMGDSKLTFSGICQINHGSHGSKAHQNAKIMVFDKLSNGIAKPILKIDENDIEASHAAVVGKINDEHIFYLTSRGLSEVEAKRIITLGYLKPILNGFDDEDVKDRILRLIEGNF